MEVVCSVLGLNFSLTEQTERPGAQDGSLNFSLTETAKELPTAMERRAPNLYINAEADSDADADILSASDSPVSAACGPSTGRASS
eukprot:Skav233811  [mRNA]  locus=scaffold7867:51704:54019:- [translate_table: standard]